MKKTHLAGAAVALLAVMSSRPASADELAETPFESANAAAVPKLLQGKAVQRSTFDHTLSADDSSRLRDLGIDGLSSAVVSLHFVPRTNGTHQVARLRTLTHSVETFAPSGVCDTIVSAGDGRGLCSGSVEGPLGRVPVRMPVTADLRIDPRGAMHFTLRNARALEARMFMSWSSIVDPDHLKIAVDLYPTAQGWFVFTRIGLGMSKQASSSKLLADALLRLDSWLCADLAHTV